MTGAMAQGGYSGYMHRVMDAKGLGKKWAVAWLTLQCQWEQA